MAQPIPVRKESPPRPRQGSERRRVTPSAAVAATTDIAAGQRRPTVGVPPSAIALAASAVLVFLLPLTFFLTGNLQDDLNLFGIAGFAVIFFTVTLSQASRAAHDPRWGGRSHLTLDDFARGTLSTASGTISGRQALVQILILPATLAVGMIAIASVYALGL